MNVPALALALALALVGCVTNSAGPSSVDVFNDGSRIVKLHVTLNLTNGSLVEEQIYVVGPGNGDEKEVASTNVSGTLLAEAWTETGLHTPRAVNATTNGMAIDVRFNDSAMTIDARGR